MQIIIETGARTRLRNLTIPSNADVLFANFSTINPDTIAQLRDEMAKAYEDEVTIEIVEGAVEFQASSRLVHAAIIDALDRRFRHRVDEDETIRLG